MVRVVVLEPADLIPVTVGHVVGERDEIEPRPVVGAERVLEDLRHRGVVGVRVLGVHVEVTRVPIRLRAHGGFVVGSGCPRLALVFVVEEHLECPLDRPVGITLVGTRHGRDTDLGGPSPRRDLSGPEAEGGLVLRHALVETARSAPAAELVLAPEAVVARLVHPEVERVPGHRVAQRDLVVGEPQTHPAGAGGHLEGNHHVGPLVAGREGPLHDLRGLRTVVAIDVIRRRRSPGDHGEAGARHQRHHQHSESTHDGRILRETPGRLPRIPLRSGPVACRAWQSPG